MNTVVRASHAFAPAETYLSDFRAACAYLAIRWTDLDRLVEDLNQKEWSVGEQVVTSGDVTGRYIPVVRLQMYNHTLVRFLLPVNPHETAVWGVLHFDHTSQPEKEEDLVLKTFEQFAAYVLAKWW